eukprot:gene11052-12218_t
MADSRHRPRPLTSLRRAHSQYAPPRMDDFVLCEKLGKGTYATVFKGYRKGGNREVVAVKCIDRKTLSKKSRENLIREIEILKGVDHEHIVKLKDFQWDNQNVFLVLEYCCGGDLSMYLRKFKKLPERTARKFLRQLSLALRYINQKNIAHMDLKPQNLLLSSTIDPILKVGDFGFAQHLLGKEGRENLRGSPLYMAVEMFCSESYDASVDLWSVGVILHETLFGYAPFASQTYEELEMKIMSKDPLVIPNEPPVSPQCHDLLARLLQRDPNNRISFEDFFNHEFIDLEHAPTAECLDRAVGIVSKAIQFDSAGNSSDALQYYCSALEFFMPAIEYERNSARKEAIRDKVKQYINRAEQIKQLQKSQAKMRSSLRRQHSLEERIVDVPQIEEAYKLSQLAERFDEEKKYGLAIENYRKSIEMYYKIIGALPSDQLRNRIEREVDKLKRRTEELEGYKDVYKSEESNESSDDSKGKCVIQ